MPKPANACAKIVIQALREHFNSLAEALLGEMGLDFEQTPKDAVTTIVNDMVENPKKCSLLADTGMRVGLGEDWQKILLNHGLTVPELEEAGLVYIHSETTSKHAPTRYQASLNISEVILAASAPEVSAA